MIRCYLGAGLLALLLGLGICSTRVLTRRHEEVLLRAQQALEAAEEGDWDRASREIRQAQNLWKSRRKLSAVLTDHGVLDRIDEALAPLPDSRDPGDYRKLCRALEALIREHRPSLENIL